MKRRKIAISLLLTGGLVLNSIYLGWAVANKETTNIAVPVLQFVFSLYLVVLAVRSVNSDTTEGHSAHVLHLTTLSAWATALLGFIVILPETPSITAFTDDAPFSAFRVPEHARLVVYALVCLIAITTPLGPPLHYHPGDIYFEKTSKR
jgi:hypothetical protein